MRCYGDTRRLDDISRLYIDTAARGFPIPGGPNMRLISHSETDAQIT
jgi:hypothetical protein